MLNLDQLLTPVFGSMALISTTAEPFCQNKMRCGVTAQRYGGFVRAVFKPKYLTQANRPLLHGFVALRRLVANN